MERRHFIFTWILFIVAATLPLSAREKGEPIVIGSIVKFQSKILGQERRIFISLPNGYADSQERYPVLYCLTLEDGMEIHYASGVARKMADAGIIPKMIVVGLCDIDGIKDLTPTYSEDYGPTSGGANAFLEHLEKEIVPFIDAAYRTQDLRIFWGHSIVGALGIYGFLKTPGLFHAYVPSSPYFIYDGNGQFLLKNTESFLKKRTSQKNFLHLTVGNEPQLKMSIESFVAKLEAMKPVGVEWQYSVKNNENHRSVMAVILKEIYHEEKNNFYSVELYCSTFDRFGRIYIYDLYFNHTVKWSFAYTKNHSLQSTQFFGYNAALYPAFLFSGIGDYVFL
jgi:predicted alpha/beta superfamily hydrolase